MISIIALLFYSYSAHAHLCMLAPMQRGMAPSINSQATPACGLAPVFGHNGPCGGTNASIPVWVQGGRHFPVILVKNEDHFYSDAPGYLEIAAISPRGDRKVLKHIPDSPTPWNYIYIEDVVLPTGSIGAVTFQALYFTNNPAVKNTTFYQCSDLMVL